MHWYRYIYLLLQGMNILRSCLNSWEKSEKVGLKLNIQKTKIMAPDPITSWQIDGETVANFVFWSSLAFTMIQQIWHGTSCEMLGWMKHKLKSRLLGEISKPHICRWHHSFGRKLRETEGERGEWKSWLRTQHSCQCMAKPTIIL